MSISLCTLSELVSPPFVSVIGTEQGEGMLKGLCVGVISLLSGSERSEGQFGI